MLPVQPKQIALLQAAFIGITAFSTSGGTSDTVTTALGTALNSAGRNGAVPNQVGSATVEGVDTATGFNLCQVYVSGTKKKLTDAAGNDVYGKLTFASPAYTLSYFSMIGTTETAYTMAASTSIDFLFPYIFSLADLPLRANTITTEQHVGPDPAAGYQYRQQVDSLTIATANTVPNLSQNVAAPGVAKFYVNGLVYTTADASPAFAVTVGSKAVTFSPANAGFSLATTDVVTAEYTY